MIGHIIDRSPNQKRIRLEKLRIELRPEGYSIVRTEYLNRLIKRLPVSDRGEAMCEAVR